jgi:hypothetical protein
MRSGGRFARRDWEGSHLRDVDGHVGGQRAGPHHLRRLQLGIRTLLMMWTMPFEAFRLTLTISALLM